MHLTNTISENRAKYIRLNGRAHYYLLTSDLSGTDDRWIYQRQFYRILDELGMSYQDWYDKYILGIDSTSRPKCLNCGKDAKFTYREGGSYQKFCSDACYSIYSKESDEYKQSMSIAVRYAQSSPEYSAAHSARVRASRSTEESRRKSSESLRRLRRDPNSPWNTQEYKDKFKSIISQSWSNHDELTRLGRCAKLSLAASKRVIEDYNTHGFLQGLLDSTKSNKSTIHYKSSYERDYIKILESDPNVIKYEWETIRIKYSTSDNHVHHYVPDVLVYYSDGRIELQEIKPSSRIQEDINVIKASAASDYASGNGWVFRYITEQDIYG